MLKRAGTGHGGTFRESWHSVGGRKIRSSRSAQLHSELKASVNNKTVQRKEGGKTLKHLSLITGMYFIFRLSKWSSEM